MPSSGKPQKESGQAVRAGPGPLGRGCQAPAAILALLTTLFCPCRTRRCGDRGGKDALLPVEQGHRRQADLDSHSRSQT